MKIQALVSFAVLSFASSVLAQDPAPAASSPAQVAPAVQATPPVSPSTTQPAGTAQATPAPYTVRTNARLVVLDMVVVDSKGNAVKGISRDHFHITEAGDPQTISNFEEAGEHTAPADGSINSTAELDKVAPQAPVNIILLDEFNTLFEDEAFARYSLKKYLTKDPGPLTTPTMLIAVDLQHFNVLQDYTQDRQKILTALDHHFTAYPWQAHNGGWLRERYGTAFLTLRRVAEAVEGHPGHKNMIWVGRGFPPLLLNDTSVDTNDRTFRLVQDTVNKLRDARVTLYTIDPAGLQVNPAESYGSVSAFTDPFGGNYQFAKLAIATGGRPLYGRNDVDAEIGTAIEDGTNFYTATYRPTNTSNDIRTFRRIKATVDVPGLTVVTRQGYYLAYTPAKVDPSAPAKLVVADLISAASSRMAYDGLAIAAAPSPTKPDTYIVHVDAGSVTWYFATDEKPRHAEVVVMVDTFDKKDKVVKQVAREIKVEAPRSVAPTGRIERPLDLEIAVEHDPKAVRARFVVRMSPQGKIGTADAVLTP